MLDEKVNVIIIFWVYFRSVHVIGYCSIFFYYVKNKPRINKCTYISITLSVVLLLYACYMLGSVKEYQNWIIFAYPPIQFVMKSIHGRIQITAYELYHNNKAYLRLIRGIVFSWCLLVHVLYISIQMYMIWYHSSMYNGSVQSIEHHVL